MLTDERRRMIAALLRARREQLRPGDLGLPTGRRRRTPGLRREEVAALAGVSAEWYTWLEQSRDVRPSADVLARIARALRFDPSASRHLMTLAGYATGSDGASPRVPERVAPHLQRLLEQLDPFPAWVRGDRWDVLAWNRGATVLYGDFGAGRGLGRNMLFAIFLAPAMRRTMVGWPAVARGVVAKVRTVYARYVGDPWYEEAIALLRTRSPEFAAWWGDHEIVPYLDGVKSFDHVEAGRLTFDFSTLELRDERYGHLNLLTYLPLPGTGTVERLRELVPDRHLADVAAEPST